MSKLGMPLLALLLAATPASAPAQAIEEVFVTSFDGSFLPAAIRKPAGAGPFPAIILLHGGVGGAGMDGVKRFMETPVTDRLLELGYLVMSADYRRYHFGEEELQDVMGAYRRLAGDARVDAGSISVIGASHGGYLAEFLATRIKPAAVISYSGGTDIEATMFDLAQKQRGTFQGYDDWLSKLLSAKGPNAEIPLELAWRFGDRRELYRNISPKHLAEKITSPVLLVMAGKDNEVSRTSGRWLIEHLKGRGVPAEYHEFAGMPHVFSLGRGEIQKTPEFRQSLELTVDFLARHARKRGR